jgi:hypothetical protein
LRLDFQFARHLKTGTNSHFKLKTIQNILTRFVMSLAAILFLTIQKPAFSPLFRAWLEY